MHTRTPPSRSHSYRLVRTWLADCNTISLLRHTLLHDISKRVQTLVIKCATTLVGAHTTTLTALHLARDTQHQSCMKASFLSHLRFPCLETPLECFSYVPCTFPPLGVPTAACAPWPIMWDLGCNAPTCKCPRPPPHLQGLQPGWLCCTHRPPARSAR